jgi:hypothetical protein
MHRDVMVAVQHADHQVRSDERERRLGQTMRDGIIVSVEADVGCFSRSNDADGVTIEAVGRQRQEARALLGERGGDRTFFGVPWNDASVSDALGPLGELCVEVVRGDGSSRAFKIVSLGPAIAITRVAFGSGAIPIQMSLIGRLLDHGGCPLHGERRGPGDGLGKANFSATSVRHYFSARRPTKPDHPFGCCLPPLGAPPVALLRAPSQCGPLSVTASAGAIHLAVIAESADVSRPPTAIANTLEKP